MNSVADWMFRLRGFLKKIAFYAKKTWHFFHWGLIIQVAGRVTTALPSGRYGSSRSDHQSHFYG